MDGYAQPQPPQAAPADAPAGVPPQSDGSNMAVMQLRKALGLPENQPAPEMKVIEACMGKFGPDVKRMAEAVGGITPGQTPTTPDPGQAGQQPAPPPTGAQQDQGSTPVQPGAATDGKMPGAATIFGRRPVGTIGDQQSTAPQDEEEAMPSAKNIFGRRR